MGKLTALLMLIVLAGGAVQAAHPLVGNWHFARIRYRGELYDPPNPQLNLRFEFFEDGTDRLFWNRTDERGFCERRGRYEADVDHFHELIIWVNPANNQDCGRDPDMQLGRTTQNAYAIRDGRLETEANMGNEVLIYIWERVGGSMSQQNP